MADDMAKNDEIQKSIGRLEKGQEVVEKALDRFERTTQETTLQMLTAFNTMREEFRTEIKSINEKVDTKTDTLHKQIDEAVHGQTKIKMSVQKLATTVSVVVGVGIYVLHGIFDIAKEAFAATFIH